VGEKKNRYIPDVVLLAKECGDVFTLSVLGRAGGLATQEKRRKEKAKAAAVARRLAAEMFEFQIQGNEHILTPDGQEGPFPDGVVRY
jgi:hypothetical protein